MTYDTYRLLFYIMGAAFLIMLALTMVLFFVLHISSVIGDLTGRTARRGIENIRNQNSASGDKRHMPSAVNRRRGKVTDRISASGKLQKKAPLTGGAPSMTERIASGTASETTLLDQNGTTVLSPEPFEQTSPTACAKPAFCEEPLSYEEPTSYEKPAPEAEFRTGTFSVDYEITYIHTDEVIS